MTWAQRFTLRQAVQQSLWIVPLVGALVGAALALLCVALEGVLTVPKSWDYSTGTAQAVLAAVAGSMIGLVGFVVTVTVLMVQMATGTFSARYMRLLYRASMLKVTLAALLGTFVFSLMLLRRVDEQVPDLGVSLAGVLVVAGVALFLVFFSRFLQSLRPVAVCAAVSQMGLRMFDEGSRVASGPEVAGDEPGPAGPIVYGTRSGTIQAIDLEGLVRFAEQHDCTLLFRCAVGDFVSPGAELVEPRGCTLPPDAGPVLEGMVALGKERTIEQDPAFAVRVMVDIGNRALSPAVNDPTTAVQVLDYLENVLLRIGATDLAGRGVFRGGDGTVRLVLPSRSWESYLSLALTEIRHYGHGSVQVARRMRALLERLRRSVLPDHVAAVERELERLTTAVQEHFGASVDFALAETADRQGLGGPG